MTRYLLALALPLALSWSAAARADQTMNDSDLFEATSKNLLVVHFDANKADVADSERLKIQHAVNVVKNEGTIKSVLVAAWSDKDYPQTKDEMLTRDDEHLAKVRANAVKQVLQDAKVGANVRTFSMAVYPSWLARIFRTDEAKLKQAVPASLGGRSRDDLALEYYGKMLRDRGGPTTAVIVIRDKDDAGTLAH
jgi:hypothetical protein